MDEEQPKLAKLPPLPRIKTRSDERRERRLENLKALPPIQSEWGSLHVGGWAEENVDGVLTVVGRCARCGEVKDGKDLRLHRRPFGQGEEWWCEPCELEPKEEMR